jgi:hypothetical protein
LSNLILTRQAARWYKLKDHPEQLRLLAAVPDGVRFPIVPAGRRSGKTERAKRFVAKQAMWLPNERYFLGAPTYNQAKKIWWDDMKALTFSAAHVRKPSESNLIIYLPNGTEIHVIGLDQPQRIEGIEWTGGVIDEIADIKAEALEANIMPALNTVNPTRPYYRAWCWFIGVPDGLNHYYDMSEYARTSGDKDYAYFHWKSSEILPPDVIASAKRTMSKRQYLQEYEASFETATGRIYDDYDGSHGGINYTDRVIKPTDALHWMHDQNFTPLSSAIAVIDGPNKDQVYLLDEIVLESAISKQSAMEFIERFRHHINKTVFIYGDPAGRAGEKHGHKSDYTDIEDILRINGWQFERRVRPAAPSIRDRQNSVRAKILNAAGETSLFVNPVRETGDPSWNHKGLATVQLQKGSTYQEDQKNPYQHITTAIGYFCDWHWPSGKSKGGHATTTGNH